MLYGPYRPGVGGHRVVYCRTSVPAVILLPVCPTCPWRSPAAYAPAWLPHRCRRREEARHIARSRPAMSDSLNQAILRGDRAEYTSPRWRARHMAIMHAAMYDAINGVTRAQPTPSRRPGRHVRGGGGAGAPQPSSSSTRAARVRCLLEVRQRHPAGPADGILSARPWPKGWYGEPRSQERAAARWTVASLEPTPRSFPSRCCSWARCPAVGRLQPFRRGSACSPAGLSTASRGQNARQPDSKVRTADQTQIASLLGRRRHSDRRVLNGSRTWPSAVGSRVGKRPHVRGAERPPCRSFRCIASTHFWRPITYAKPTSWEPAGADGVDAAVETPPRPTRRAQHLQPTMPPC